MDIKDFDGIPYKNKIDVVIGSPPCRSFSLANISNKKEDSSLINEFMRIVKEIEPKIWIWENVKGAKKAVKEGYIHIWKGTDFGMLQNRERMFVSNIQLKPNFLLWDKQWLNAEKALSVILHDRGNIYTSFYTLTGRSCGTRGHTGHFDGHMFERGIGFRTYTLEEGMQLQTLPFYFKFCGNSKSSIGQQLGDMVPPLMAYKIALFVMEYLTNQQSKLMEVKKCQKSF